MPCLGECNVHKSTDFFQNSAGPIASTFLAGTLGLHEILIALAFISRHLWMPHVGHRQFDQRARAQTDGKIFVTSVVIFSSVGCSVLLLALTLTANPFSTSPMDPGIGGLPNE